ncbi:MAG: phage major tail tube protein [Desulfovibrio sp.]|nr:phage major tail tube protein [Desulfovibrio sp.]
MKNCEEVAQSRGFTDCNYFKLTIAGGEVVTVDAKNLVRRVRGMDQMAAIKDAIGL